MSNYLLPDAKDVIPVSMELARIIGLNEAIILQQIHYWCDLNKKNKKNFHDGEHWVFQTLEEWSEQFPFSLRTVKTVFKSLEEAGFLIVGNYNKMRIDRTKWYRVNYKLLEAFINQPLCNNCTLPSCRYCTKDWAKVARAIQEIKKETNVQEIKKHKTVKQVLPITLYTFSNDEDEIVNQATAIVEFYYTKYEQHVNKKHPKLKENQLNRVYDNIMEHLYDGFDGMLWTDIINQHMERSISTGKNDLNINAFATETNLSIYFMREGIM